MEDPFDLLIRLNLPLAHAVIDTFAEMRLYVLCALCSVLSTKSISKSVQKIEAKKTGFEILPKIIGSEK